MLFLICTWIAGSCKRWQCRLMVSPTFGFLSLSAGEEESIDKESESSPLVETFCFLLFIFLFVTLLWDSCFFLAKESFSSFLCLSRLTGIGLCSLVSLFSPSCIWLGLSPDYCPWSIIFSGVQYGILMGLIKILKRRYLVYDDLSFFRISGQNWKRKEGMGSSMIKGR